MKIKCPAEIDVYDLVVTGIPFEEQTDFLTELFMMFGHQHTIDAYKRIQGSNPHLFPPLLEEQ